MDTPWQPPPEPPLPRPQFGRPRRPPRRNWLPAAIIGSAIVIAAGLAAGALILRSAGRDSGADRMSTCQAWTEARQILQAVPALPAGWNWDTPNIDKYIRMQNAPVGKVLDVFEAKIAAEPADVAQAARDYVAKRREQIRSLSDRTYTLADGVAVDVALGRLDELCGTDGQTTST